MREQRAGVFLREYDSIPGGYMMKYYTDNLLHEIRAMFHYTKVNSTAPKLSDYQ